MNKTLKEVLGETPEAYVKRVEIIVKIKSAVTINRFSVEDESMAAFIEFHPDATKFRDRLEEGRVYKFFSLERINSETLLFRKNSFLMEEKSDKGPETTNNKSYITLKDLVGKTENTVVREPVLMKVLKIYDMRKTSSGIDFRKVLLGDHFFQVNLTLWRDEAHNVSKMFEEDNVYSLSHFTMDSWPKDIGITRPKDIKYDKRKTKVDKLKSESIPSQFETVKLNYSNEVLIGQIRFLDDLYEYMSCPGKSEFCGKAVKTGQVFCSKIGCSLKIDQVQLVADYRVKLMLVDKESDFHSVTAFGKTLKMHEESGDSITDRLKKVIGPTVKLFINPSKGEDDPILNNIEFVE